MYSRPSPNSGKVTSTFANNHFICYHDNNKIHSTYHPHNTMTESILDQPNTMTKSIPDSKISGNPFYTCNKNYTSPQTHTHTRIGDSPQSLNTSHGGSPSQPSLARPGPCLQAHSPNYSCPRPKLRNDGHVHMPW